MKKVGSLKDFEELYKRTPEADGEEEGLGNLSSDARHEDLNPIHKYSILGDWGRVQVLFQSGEDPALQDSEGNTFLHIGIISGHYEFLNHLSLFITPKIVDMQNNQGYNAIHLAVFCSANIILLLIKKSSVASLYSQSSEKLTPLHIAVLEGKLEIVVILLEYLPIAALDVRDDTGYTPLDLAIAQSDADAAKLIKAKRAGPNSSSLAKSGNNNPTGNEGDVTQTLNNLTSISTAADPKKIVLTPKQAPSKWTVLVNLIIRPKRHIYPVEQLGPSVFTMGGRPFRRKDFVILNTKGQALQCSMWESAARVGKAPCVIVCHGNAGSRCFAIDAVQKLLPLGISVVGFDFSGSGLSEGDYVSLGFNEQFDLACVVEHLINSGTVSNIGVWGRSMGAVTAILYCAQMCSSSFLQVYSKRSRTSSSHTDTEGRPEEALRCIKGLVLDSPFSSLNKVMLDLVKNYSKWIPEAAVKLAQVQIRRSIQKRAGVDIRKLDVAKESKMCYVPAVLAHAKGDDFINISHHYDIANAYGGQSISMILDGNHSSPRGAEFHDLVKRFFLQQLIPDHECAKLQPVALTKKPDVNQRIPAKRACECSLQ